MKTENVAVLMKGNFHCDGCCNGTARFLKNNGVSVEIRNASGVGSSDLTEFGFSPASLEEAAWELCENAE